MKARRIAIPAVLLVLALSSLAQAALTLEAGVILEGPGRTRFTIASPISLSSLRFASNGAPILEGITLDFRAGTGYANWTLSKFGTSQIQVQGTPTSSGSMRVDGLGGFYSVAGVSGTREFTIEGSGDDAWHYPAAAQTVTISRQLTTAEEVDRAASAFIAFVIVAVVLGVGFSALYGARRD